MAIRYITVRHATSGRWCLEAPHPTVDVPQPYYLPGVPCLTDTKRAMQTALEKAGYLLINNPKQKRYFVYKGGRPLIAE